MKTVQLDNQLSISDQITVDDVAQLVNDGVAILMCNRPDGEAAGQPTFADIKKAANALDIEAVHIPFVAGKMSEQHIEQFREHLATGKRIHAYCRTGNRCKGLWQASQSSLHTEKATPQKVTNPTAKPHYDIVIAGAGSAGIAVSASLLKRNPKLRIALIDPASEHCYQPGWTMVGGGVFDVVTTKRRMEEVIPSGVVWIPSAVTDFFTEDNKVLLANQNEVYYDHLVVATGLKLDWEAVEGLPEALGKNGVTSNYRYDLAPYTWQLVQNTKQGKALFTQPPMPIKCAGAPQKALYLSADYWHKNGIDIDVHFYNAGAVLFGVKEYVPALSAYMEKYQAQLHFQHQLKKIDGETKTAWFSHINEDGTETTVTSDFDMIHVCPPQCAPDFIRKSNLIDADGWVDVEPASLRHRKFDNIWALGDVTNTPNAKTLAAVRKQAPVVAQNICDVLGGKTPSVAYDGYGSCPLTVERGKIVLAEFAYGGKLSPTFPQWLNDGTKPTKFAWGLKAKVLPWVYWQGMLKGHEWLATPQKNN